MYLCGTWSSADRKISVEISSTCHLADLAVARNTCLKLNEIQQWLSTWAQCLTLSCSFHMLKSCQSIESSPSEHIEHHCHPRCSGITRNMIFIKAEAVVIFSESRTESQRRESVVQLKGKTYEYENRMKTIWWSKKMVHVMLRLMKNVENHLHEPNLPSRQWLKRGL